MTEYLVNRYSELLGRRGEKFFVLNGTLFISYNRTVIPFGPAKEKTDLTEHDAHMLFDKLGGLLIRFSSTGFDESVSKEWYAVICDQFIPVESIKSKLRNELKKSLLNCEIRKVDARYISKNGYEIYQSANSGYKKNVSVSFDDKAFAMNALAGEGFEDILHYWGIFYKTKLIGYSANYIFETTEALYTSVKISPAYLKLFPLYSLIYKMNEYYLENESFDYVNDGFRSIMHETNIQNFLISKLNFTRRYLALNVFYRPVFREAVFCFYPLRGMVGKIDPRINAILEIERIRRS